jgi:hypothetical protein
MSLLAGCAQITTSTTVRVLDRPGPPLLLDSASEQVAARSFGVEWLQLGRILVVRVDERRVCRGKLLRPVLRTERIVRRAGPTLIWELAFGAAFTGLSAFIFAKPEPWSPEIVDENGRRQPQVQVGYGMGAFFSAIAAISWTSAAVDIARSRDEVRVAEAYVEEPGLPAKCRIEAVPLVNRDLTLVVAGEEVLARTDLEGRARFVLPAALDHEAPGSRRASIVVDADHAISVSVRVPFVTPPTDAATAVLGTAPGEPPLAEHGRVDAPPPLLYP